MNAQESFDFMTIHHHVVGFSHNPPRPDRCIEVNYPLWMLFVRTLNSPAELSSRDWTEIDVVGWAQDKINGRKESGR